MQQAPDSNEPQPKKTLAMRLQRRTTRAPTLPFPPFRQGAAPHSDVAEVVSSI